MIPVLSRKSALFLVLGVFALLFGMIQTASAAECRSYDSSNPAYPGNPDPYWQGAGNPSIDNCTIKYDDPVGGSNLTVCQYRVLSNGTETLGWTNATGTCNENSAMLSIDISIGSGLNCRDNGENKCVVEFKAQDNAGNSAASPPPVVTLDINYNTAPTISDIANQTINEDANTGALAFTIGDAETAASSLTLTKDSSNTALIPTANIVFGGSGANRTVTVTPAENLSGSATITVTVSDGSLTASDTFVLAVTAVNDAPSFTKGANQTVLEDAGAQTVTGWATSISSGPANESGQAVDFIVSNNNNALFSAQPAIAANGTLTYTPTPNANGSATVTVQIHDNGGTANSGVDTSASQTFAITVTAVNDAPTLNAIADPAAINEDAGSQIVNLSGISAGGGESQTLAITVTSSVTSLIPNPTVTYTSPNATGSLSYTPVANANGSAVITVTVKDAGLNGTAGDADDGIFSRTFTVSVTAVNDAPTASNGTLTTNEDTAGTGTLAASDVDGNPLTYSIVANGVKGTAVITNTSTGAYIYDPNGNQNGTDSFTFKVNDGTVDSNTATITVTITAVNDAPVAVGESYSMYEGATLTRNAAAGVLANDTDVEGSILTAITVSIPTNGSLILNSNGSLVYTPIANFNGTDSFTYKANDGTADSNTATVTITVSDGTAPTVTSFAINSTSCSGSNCNNQVVVNSTFTIAWTASESGGSYLSNAKIYNAVFVTGSCDNNNKSGCSWNQVGSTQSAPAGSNSWSSSTTDNPVDNTYWYGIHIADNAENCIDEDAGDTDKGHCGGVTSDSLDNTRTDRGPIKVKMQHNSSPTIQGNVGISPAPPVKAGVALTFSVDWNDQDAGEQVKIHICKDVLSVSGASCNMQGSWCASSSFTTSDPATCTYTTLATDGGDKAYNAYVCDDEGACSSAKSGTFLVDTQAPTVTINLQNNAGATITEVNQQGQPNDTLYIHVGSSTDNVGIAEVRFSSDDSQNGVREGTWTSWEQWNASNGDWNKTTKRMAWEFTTSGQEEVWAELKDTAGNTAEAKKNFYVNVTPSSSLYRWDGSSYVPDQDGNPQKLTNNWKDTNFTRHIFDQDTDGTLSACAWMATDMGEVSRAPCSNASFNTLNVTVGSGQACATQGENQCVVFVNSTDNDGAVADYGISTYSADWSDPVITNNPSFVQSESTGTFSITASDNIELNYCWLYDATSGLSYSLKFYQDACNQGGELSACPGGTSCKACRDMDFPPLQGHALQVICSDQYDMETSLVTGSTTYLNTTSLAISSVFVTLSASPASGSVNTLFDFVATVSGTMTGNINYKFDCTNDGTWERDITPSPIQNPYTATDLCQYPSPGTYTAKVFVQRGVGTAEDTQSIVVSSNSIPTTTNRLVDAPNSVDYCGVTGYPPVRVRWTFSDADPEDTQSAYEIEVFQGVTKVIDTGKRLGSTQSYVFQSAGEQLLWNTIYTWQVRVWDTIDDVSIFAAGPQFTTAAHYYPVPSFEKTPEFPGAQELIQFQDQTNFATGSTGKTWSWTFGDGGSSSTQNPSHTYAQTGAFGVTLQSGDDVGSCSASQSVNVSVPFPEWQEISPF